MDQQSEFEVDVSAGEVTLPATLAIPPSAVGAVLFAHGSGSSRFSSRNRFVATELQRNDVATLLLDLLTAEEERVDTRTAQLRFDISLLARRLVAATDWLRHQERTRDLGVGYFGASTGGGAALVAAAVAGESVRAVVSRGGRPDLAGDALRQVVSPTLLIVGGRDLQVIAMNEEAYAELKCEKRLEIVKDATHLFEEPGALEQVARLASEWFATHFRSSNSTAPATSRIERSPEPSSTRREPT